MREAKLSDSQDPQYGYFSLVNDEAYLEGALVMAHSLLQTTSLPLTVLVSELSQEAERRLRNTGARIRQIPTHSVNTGNEQNFPARTKTFSKFFIWKLTGFEKGVFIDADTLIMESIDDLFQYDEFSACGSEEYYNTGVFVFEPSADTFNSLMRESEIVADDESYSDDSEQELLQRHFHARFTSIERRFNYRPYNENSISLAANNPNSPIRFLSRVFPWIRARVIHFIGYPKPWEIYVDGCERPANHYTWTEKELRRVRWSFELWNQKYRSLLRSERERVDY